jgi:hypothetical protein
MESLELDEKTNFILLFMVYAEQMQTGIEILLAGTKKTLMSQNGH